MHTHYLFPWHKDFGGGVCIKALPSVIGAAIDLVVDYIHRAITLRSKLPILLNQCPLVANAPTETFCLRQCRKLGIVGSWSYCKSKAAAFRDESLSLCAVAGSSIPGS